jgi:L-lactate dehydrogenase (cytochrome)
VRLSDVQSLLRFDWPELGADARALQRCHNVADFRRVARRRLPRGVFDYIDGGAEDEHTVAANVTAFAGHELHPMTLRGVDDVDMRTTILGRRSALPLGLAPTGFTRMAHTDGERAVAHAAAGAGVPYTLSTMGTVSLEDLAATAACDRWFQLYIWRDRGISRELVDRAAASGYRVLMITVDTPVPGRRERDLRNGFTIPPVLGPAALTDLALHPRWWWRLLRDRPITFANVTADDHQDPAGVMAYVADQFDPRVTWDDIAAFRQRWQGPMALKGILTPDDAARAADLGVDGVVLSNHGGRQLDRAAPPVMVLPAVRDRVGDRVELLVDSGVRRGGDLAIAVALGASACLVGRAYLYALATGGAAGVSRLLDLFATQLRTTMQLCGVASITELRDRGPDLVRPPAP